MEHLEEIIAGLNACIAAGADVRFVRQGYSVPVVGQITLAQQLKQLHVHFIALDTPLDQECFVSIKTKFTVELNDFPNDLRENGWS